MNTQKNVKKHRNLQGGTEDGKMIERNDGGGSFGNRFSVFDFTSDDERVEMDSRDKISNFRIKTPLKKFAEINQRDKYDFFSSFKSGTLPSQNNSRIEPSVEVIDDSLGDITISTNVSVPHDFPSCRLKSPSYKKVLCKDLNNDGMPEMKSGTLFDLGASGGLTEEKSSYIGTDSNDCESVVVVTPNYAKLGNVYYTSCFLTFSRRSIVLKGSSIREGKSHHCLEWSNNDIAKIECQPCESVKADVVSIQFKCKDSSESRTCNMISETVGLEFALVDDSLWSKTQDEIKLLDPKYETAWRTITRTYNSCQAFEDTIYPKGDPDAVLISWRDVELLQPRTFINDTIIDFYMKYIFNEIVAEERQRFHIFNTFFFRKLAGLDLSSSRDWEGKEAFQRVHKWTKNLHLFQKDYIFIPVNFSLHWSLIVICHMGKVVDSREEKMGYSTEMPCILHMDSLQGSHRGLENLIRSYIREEWKEHQNKLDDDIEKMFKNLPFITLELPQQDNLFDCGLFLLHYAELFIQQPESFLMMKNNTLNGELFLPAEVSLKKRDHIRNLLFRIAEGAEGDSRVSGGCTCSPGDDLNDRDSDVMFVKEINVDYTHHCLKLDSSSDQEILVRTPVWTPVNQKKHLVSMLGPRNASTSTSDVTYHPRLPLVSINEFSNMMLPAEGFELRTSANVLRRDKPTSHEDDDRKTHMPSSYRLSDVAVANMKYWYIVSPNSALSRPNMIDIQNLASVNSTYEEKNDCPRTSLSSEDLTLCVVEDSEDENETADFTKSGRESFLYLQHHDC